MTKSLVDPRDSVMENGCNRPFFSVLIAAYNRPLYLELAVASVLKSTYGDFEIVISDDKAPNSGKIATMVRGLNADKRIRFYAQCMNVGMVKNWNFLTSVARGKFILFMGDDDELKPNTLERLAAIVQRRPEYDLFGFGYDVINGRGARLYRRRAGSEVVLTQEDAFSMRELIIARCVPFWLCHPFSICYRAEIAREITYSEDVHIAADLLFLYDCMRANKKMLIVPEILFCWRKFQVSEVANGSVQVNLSAGTNGLVARALIVEYLKTHRTKYARLLADLSDGDLQRQLLRDAFYGGGENPQCLLQTVCARAPALKYLFQDLWWPNAQRKRLEIIFCMVYAYIRICGLKGLHVVIGYLAEVASRRVQQKVFNYVQTKPVSSSDGEITQ